MRLEDYQQIVDASNIQMLESQLVRFANELGFGIISGVLVVEHGAGKVSMLRFGNTPAAFLPMFTNSELGKRDPVLLRLKRLYRPFVYDQSMYVNEQAGDLWEVQARFGYKTGIATGLRLPAGKHFVIGVDRDQPLPGDGIQVTRMMADLQLLAAHTQEAIIRLLAPSSFEMQCLPRLTERETEILKWTAEGKSAWAVGQILNVSEHNVKYHVKQLLVKLSVGSKHQAAARARSLGLI
jgi:DNA-binding CsgD family transcriptional regulator